MTDARSEPRNRVRLWARIQYRAGSDTNAVVHDLSARGFRFEAKRLIDVGDVVQLWIADRLPLSAKVSHVSAGGIGCRFAPPLSTATLEDLLRGGPFASAPPASVTPDPVMAIWPGWARVGFVIVGAAGSWTIVGAVVARMLF